MSIVEQLKNSEVVGFRQHFHAYPELSNSEEKTAEYIVKFLSNFEGLEFAKGVAGHGVVVDINAPGATKTLLMRADMDALPIEEKNNVTYKSRNKGIMHACGHDAHMAILMGVIKSLMAQADKLKVNVRFVFQPAEEGGGGAANMIKAGVLGDNVVAAIALHMFPDIPCGMIGLKKGAIMASVDEFVLTMNGVGGHGATPEKTSVLPYVASQVVNGLYSMVPRKFAPTENSLLSVTSIDCKSSNNVMPTECVIEGSMRNFTNYARDLMPVYAEQFVGCTCAGLDVDYKFDVARLYPPLINNGAMVDELEKVVHKMAKPYYLDAPLMISEDFAFFAEYVPSVFALLGCGNKAKGINKPLHSDEFNIDEDSLDIGVKMLVQFALNFK
ncbi:MAG: amidohydrolase [Clostridiales bacterium]|jgi:amidohydrolase|nr:amidohydrolase [Clostridiales bacterium]